MSFPAIHTIFHTVLRYICHTLILLFCNVFSVFLWKFCWTEKKGWAQAPRAESQINSRRCVNEWLTNVSQLATVIYKQQYKCRTTENARNITEVYAIYNRSTQNCERFAKNHKKPARISINAYLLGECTSLKSSNLVSQQKPKRGIWARKRFV